MCLRVLHPVDGAAALGLLKAAQGNLRTGGRFIAADHPSLRGRARFARALILRNREPHVRSVEETGGLVHQVCSTAQVATRHDQLRVPYSHIVMMVGAPVQEAVNGP